MTDPEDRRSDRPLLQTRLIDKRTLSPGTAELDLARPNGFSFLPGQRIRLYHGALSRDYSLACEPAAAKLSVCVRLVKGGAFSERIRAAAAGDAFSLTGPHGYFVFQPSDRPAVWVATGTGIAPFAAMAGSGITGAIVLHGVRTAEELYYADRFRQTAAEYIPCLSAPDEAMDQGYSGRATGFLQKRLSAGVYDFYLCGRREMIRDATLIIDDRFEGSRIFTEIFF